MSRILNFVIAVSIFALLVVVRSENITIDLRVFAQLPIPSVKPNISSVTTPSASSVATRSNNATITIHTTNSIQGSNIGIIKQEEPVIRKAILSNIDNAIVIAKGTVKSTVPVNVSAKIINQPANARVDTTQGTDMTKKLIATELVNAINTTNTNGNAAAPPVVLQPAKVVVDNQAVCSGIASPTKAACVFTINIHR